MKYRSLYSDFVRTEGRVFQSEAMEDHASLSFISMFEPDHPKRHDPWALAPKPRETGEELWELGKIS
jgi:hypothetical protein